MHNWLVLLPPVFVLLIAFFTHNILISIIVGIASATLIATNFSILKATILLYDTTKEQLLNTDNLYMIGFAFILSAIIVLINYTGGACALGHAMTKRLRSARDAQTASLIMSFFLCIDDYLSSLTNGCLMQSITDKFKVPRAKLAFLINTMASPLVVLIPISSWMAIIIRQLDLSGLSMHTEHFVRQHIHVPGGIIHMGKSIIIQSDPFYTYLKAIPFLFYSFILIASVWFIVRRKISYGPMKKHEDIAKKTGNLYAHQAPRFCRGILTEHDKNYLSDFFVPIVTLMLCTLVGLIYTGGYKLFGGPNTLLESFKHAKIYPVLFFAGTISLVLSSSLALARGTLRFKKIPALLTEGTQLIQQPVIIIFSALVFGELLNHALFTGAYVAALILPYISIHWIPFITFVTTSIVAMGTGSSWGTIAIMFPISIQMAGILTGLPNPIILPDIYILLPTIGAVISGSLAGAQLSPIADPITVSAMSAGAYQIDHVKTQTPYILPALIGTCVSFIAAGFLKIDGPTVNALICLGIGLIISLMLLTLLNMAAKHSTKQAHHTK